MTSVLDVAKRAYECFAEGDPDGFLALCADDVEWVVNGPVGVATCRAFHGRDGVEEFLGVLGASTAMDVFTPREYHAAGSTVVVLGDCEGKDLVSGVPFVRRWSHVFDVDGGRITRLREFLCCWPGGEEPPPMSWTTG